MTAKAIQITDKKNRPVLNIDLQQQESIIYLARLKESSISPARSVISNT